MELTVTNRSYAYTEKFWSLDREEDVGLIIYAVLKVRDNNFI